MTLIPDGPVYGEQVTQALEQLAEMRDDIEAIADRALFNATLTVPEAREEFDAILSRIRGGIGLDRRRPPSASARILAGRWHVPRLTTPPPAPPSRLGSRPLRAGGRSR